MALRGDKIALMLKCNYKMILNNMGLHIIIIILPNPIKNVNKPTWVQSMD